MRSQRTDSAPGPSHHQGVDDRFRIPTCVACGAMGIPGSCDGGCREERLDLVGADAMAELAAERRRSRSAAVALRELVSATAGLTADGDSAEHAYPQLQAMAREALRTHPPGAAAGAPEPRAATVWWCPDCGGADAPQPCLGVCVWHPVDWVRRELWDTELAGWEADLEQELALRRFARQVAFVTPRPGRFQQSWRLISGAAEGLRSPAAS